MFSTLQSSCCLDSGSSFCHIHSGCGGLYNLLHPASYSEQKPIKAFLTSFVPCCFISNKRYVFEDSTFLIHCFFILLFHSSSACLFLLFLFSILPCLLVFKFSVLRCRLKFQQLKTKIGRRKEELRHLRSLSKKLDSIPLLVPPSGYSCPVPSILSPPLLNTQTTSLAASSSSASTSPWPPPGTRLVILVFSDFFLCVSFFLFS